MILEFIFLLFYKMSLRYYYGKGLYKTFPDTPRYRALIRYRYLRNARKAREAFLENLNSYLPAHERWKDTKLSEKKILSARELDYGGYLACDFINVYARNRRAECLTWKKDQNRFYVVGGPVNYKLFSYVAVAQVGSSSEAKKIAEKVLKFLVRVSYNWSTTRGLRALPPAEVYLKADYLVQKYRQRLIYQSLTQNARTRSNKYRSV